MIKAIKKHTSQHLQFFELPSADATDKTVILLHGYGADAQDLMSISQFADPQRQWRWLFLDGPLQIQFSPFYSGRAWFPIDVEKLQQAQHSGHEDVLTQHTPKGLIEAKQLILQSLEELNIPLSSVVIGGFSQGAMVATEIALSCPEMPAGLIVLSGSLLDENRWQKLSLSRAGLPFFQSHGDTDPMLNLSLAIRLEKVFLAAKMIGQLHIFRGGHEIPSHLIPLIHSFLSTSL